MARVPETAVRADAGQNAAVPAVGSVEFESLARAYWAWAFDAPDRPEMLSEDFYRCLD
jgi:hypothetical protein